MICSSCCASSRADRTTKPVQCRPKATSWGRVEAIAQHRWAAKRWSLVARIAPLCRSATFTQFKQARYLSRQACTVAHLYVVHAAVYSTEPKSRAVHVMFELLSSIVAVPSCCCRHHCDFSRGAQVRRSMCFCRYAWASKVESRHAIVPRHVRLQAWPCNLMSRLGAARCRSCSSRTCCSSLSFDALQCSGTCCCICSILRPAITGNRVSPVQGTACVPHRRKHDCTRRQCLHIRRPGTQHGPLLP